MAVGPVGISGLAVLGGSWWCWWLGSNGSRVVGGRRWCLCGDGWACGALVVGEVGLSEVAWGLLVFVAMVVAW